MSHYYHHRIDRDTGKQTRTRSFGSKSHKHVVQKRVEDDQGLVADGMIGMYLPEN